MILMCIFEAGQVYVANVRSETIGDTLILQGLQAHQNLEDDSGCKLKLNASDKNDAT